jgi:hypothetical protein
MATSSPEILSNRGKTAALSRSRHKDDPELIQARTDLEEAKLNKHLLRYREAIDRLVSQAPPLTPDTQASLRNLLGEGVKIR